MLSTFSRNHSSSDDSFISTEKPKKKKVQERVVIQTQPKKNKEVKSQMSKCPVCIKSFKSVLQHLNKCMKCRSQCTNEQIQVIQNENKYRRTEKMRENAKKSNERMRNENLETLKTRNRINNRRFRARQNPQVFREYKRKGYD